MKIKDIFHFRKDDTASHPAQGDAGTKLMKAVAVTPGEKNSARLIDAPAPVQAEGQVLVETLQIGVCGTDLEIDRAEYGIAPPGDDYLILGHENFGRVESVVGKANGLAPGDYVVGMVRRPDDCHHCLAGEQDMCIMGGYTERGIKGRHGFFSEHYVESAEYLVKVPRELKGVGVLLEPLTVVEKGARHAWSAQQRMKDWRPKKALILGAGPIGMLGAMLIRLKGLETFIYARDTSELLTERAAAIGASYIPQLSEAGEIINHIGGLPQSFGPFDFILEATGSEKVALGAMRIIGLNGILCLTSVTGGEGSMDICPACVNLELVLGNRTIFGTVNANRVDFEQGVKDLGAAFTRWPGWLESLITRRVPMERFREAFDRRPGDVKVVVEVGGPV